MNDQMWGIKMEEFHIEQVLRFFIGKLIMVYFDGIFM